MNKQIRFKNFKLHWVSLLYLSCRTDAVVIVIFRGGSSLFSHELLCASLDSRYINYCKRDFPLFTFLKSLSKIWLYSTATVVKFSSWVYFLCFFQELQNEVCKRNMTWEYDKMPCYCHVCKETLRDHILFKCF